MHTSVALYKEIVKQDPGDFEALASVGAFYFHDEQPEMAITFYRSVHSEGCSIYSKKIDVALTFALCFRFCHQTYYSIFATFTQRGCNAAYLLLESLCKSYQHGITQLFSRCSSLKAQLLSLHFPCIECQ